MKQFTVQMSMPTLRWHDFVCTTSATPGMATALQADLLIATTFLYEGGFCLFTISGGHTLLTGQLVTMDVQSDVPAQIAEFSGEKEVEFVSTTKFRYRSLSSTTVVDSATARLIAQAQNLVLRADDFNTDDVYFGPTSGATFTSISPGASYALDSPRGSKFYPSDFYVKSATASQVIRVLYV